MEEKERKKKRKRVGRVGRERAQEEREPCRGREGGGPGGITVEYKAS